jgi:hypothetical protein
MACTLAFLCGVPGHRLSGQTVASPSVTQSHEPLNSIAVTDQQAKESVQWLADLALKKLPATIDGDKDWGETKRVWSGVDVKADGWKLKTHRRYREVEHGRWIRYQVQLPDPALGQAVAVEIHRVLPAPAGAEDQARWRIESSILAPLRFTARIQFWNLGVRVYSVTVSGQMRVRLSSVASISFFADYSEVPPALVLDPRIEQAHLSLEGFEVERVSRIGGDAAEQWGEVMQEILVERLVRKQNDKLVEKLNRAIDKERAELRFSMREWFRPE